MVESDKTFWQNKAKEFSKVICVVIAAVICIIIGWILVFIWFVETSPIGLQGAATFNDWTLDWVVGFFILLTLWELLLVGVPTGLFFGVGGYLWWRNLSDEVKQEFKDRDKKGKAHRKEKYGGSGGFSLVVFIGYCLLHGIRGTYNATFGTRSYIYWVSTWFETIMWIFIVLGGPILIIVVIWYLTKGRKKSE